MSRYKWPLIVRVPRSSHAQESPGPPVDAALRAEGEAALRARIVAGLRAEADEAEEEGTKLMPLLADEAAARKFAMCLGVAGYIRDLSIRIEAGTFPPPAPPAKDGE